MRRRLKAKIRKLDRRVERAQRGRKRLNELALWFRNRGFEAMARNLKDRAEAITDRIRQMHGEIRAAEAKLEELANRGGRARFVEWVRGEVGVTEHSERHRWYIATAGHGGSEDWPWCSIFASAGLVAAGGFEPGELPSNPWYSGAWLTWGRRVSYSDAQPGDLVVYDWGDGGMTDHVEVYVGQGQGIGGNESHPSGGAVIGPRPVSVANVVALVRPDF